MLQNQPHKTIPWLARVLLATSLLATPSLAAIPEPSSVIFGDFTGTGSPTGALVEARFQGTVVASYVVGSIPAAGERYALVVRLEEPREGDVTRTVGVLWLNDEVELFLNGADTLQRVQVVDRGLVSEIDLALVGLSGDQDGDGVENAADNCGSAANPMQEDANDNGIGDACESTVFSTLFSTLAATGGAGNAADPLTGRGAVATEFEMMATEVTNAQYIELLNAVADSADPNSLYNAAMGSDPRGGITATPEGGGATRYRVKPNMGDKPVNFVSWTDAARFANWVHNGMPAGAQGVATTEAGAYDLSVATPGIAALSTANARWRLPTEDEWYKAAYFAPALPGYRLYPTSSDSEPLRALADELGNVSNPGLEVANYDGTAVWNGQQGNVTTVMSSGGLSPLGFSDMGGNVAEWLDAPAEDSMRVARGGSFSTDRLLLAADADVPARTLVLFDPSFEGPDVGIRLVPEPASSPAAIAALATLLWLSTPRSRSGKSRG